MDLGFWAVGTLHSTATLSIPSGPAVCMGFGSCTVSIFSCSATATRPGGPRFFFWFLNRANPNLKKPFGCYGARALNTTTFVQGSQCVTEASIFLSVLQKHSV
ncbi:unnamed protein product [Mycena citricolor]|uniref:Uncharacterized protein n=1 Tax=Mycena citricolor TaxID=2018698 RepID=A0AAD2JX25_9AGAR|nr:unnamed protein product [Mycena citricolor]